MWNNMAAYGRQPHEKATKPKGKYKKHALYRAEGEPDCAKNGSCQDWGEQEEEEADDDE